MPIKTVKTTTETVIIISKEELVNYCKSVVGEGFTISDNLYLKRDPYDGDEWLFDGFKCTKVEENA